MNSQLIIDGGECQKQWRRRIIKHFFCINLYAEHCFSSLISGSKMVKIRSVNNVLRMKIFENEKCWLKIFESVILSDNCATSRTTENWMKNGKNANRLFFIWNIINLTLKREKKGLHSAWNSYQHERSSQATTNGFWSFYRSRTIGTAFKINNATDSGDSLKRAIK